MTRRHDWKLDVVTHAIGVPLALVGMAALVGRAVAAHRGLHEVAIAAGFCMAFALVFILSAIYHASIGDPAADSSRFNRLDRLGIFGAVAWSGLAHAWLIDEFRGAHFVVPIAPLTTLVVAGCSAAGIWIETTRPRTASHRATGLYFVMVAPLVLYVLGSGGLRAPSRELRWVLGGAGVYVVAVLVYWLDVVQDRAAARARVLAAPAPRIWLPLAHSVWHVLVIGACACHYHALWLALGTS